MYDKESLKNIVYSVFVYYMSVYIVKYIRFSTMSLQIITNVVAKKGNVEQNKENTINLCFP